MEVFIFPKGPMSLSRFCSQEWEWEARFASKMKISSTPLAKAGYSYFWGGINRIVQNQHHCSPPLLFSVFGDPGLSMVSQMKIKVSTFFSIFGALPFWRRFALNIFKKWNCLLLFVLIGSLADVTKVCLMFVFRFVIWITASGQFVSNIICKNTTTLSISDLSMLIVLKSTKKQHKFLAELSTKSGNISRCASPPNENRPGVFTRGTWSSVGLAQSWRPQGSSPIDCFWLLFGCLGSESLVKPS